MSSKKRSRKEFDSDDQEWTVTTRTPEWLITRLCVLLGLDSSESQEQLRKDFEEQFHSSTQHYVLPERDSTVQLRKTKKVSSLWNIVNTELSQPPNKYNLPKFELRPLVQRSSAHFISQLQSRSSSVMDARMKRYFRALCVLEYEHDQGSLADTEFEPTMVNESCWTPLEKKRFFIALERCGQNMDEIARRVGPSKTVAEVYDYLKTLELASKAIGKEPLQHLTAREMSPLYIVQEDHMALQLEQTLETEKYAKHLQLCQDPPEEIQKSEALLEIWNMSSLTRLFAGINDMTILSSSTYNFYQLLKSFVSDIIIDLHTQLLNSSDKTVSRSLMNYVIAKRQKVLEDRRLQQMDVLAMLDRRYKLHTKYSANRSASFLAKRRKIVQVDDEDVTSQEVTPQEEENEEEEEVVEVDDDNSEDFIQVSSDNEEEEIRWDGENHNSDSDDTDSEDDQDNDDTSFDDQDKLEDRYITMDDEFELREALKGSEDIEVVEDDDDSYDERSSDDEDYEEEQEQQMKILDRIHEDKLVKYLEFYGEDLMLLKKEEPPQDQKL